MNKKMIPYLALVLVIAVTVINLLYWGTRKQGYHLDECYTYGYCCEFDSIAIIRNAEDGGFFNNWHDSSLFADYYTIDDGEAFDYRAAIEKMKISCHPPMFYLVFFTIASIVRVYSKWIGISINIVATIGALLGIYGISLKLTKKSKGISLFMALIYGLSSSTVSGVVFIRMYAMLSMMTVLYIYVCATVWENVEDLYDSKNTKRIKWYLLLYLITVIGSLTHYFFFVFAFFFCGFTCLYFLTKKQWRVFIEYGLSELLGVGTSVLLYPAMLKDFVGSRGTKTTNELVSLSSNFSGKIKSFSRIINKNAFGTIAVILLIVSAVLLSAFVLKFFYVKVKKQEQISFIEKDDISFGIFYFITAFSTGLYFLFVAKCTQYKSLRYVQNVCPIALLVGFIGIVYLTKKVSVKKVFLILPIGLFILVTIFSYTKCGVQNLYEEDREQTDLLKEYSRYPVICISTDNQVKQKQFFARESINFIYGQKIYVADSLPDVSILDVFSEKPEAYVMIIAESYGKEAVEEMVSTFAEESGMNSVTELCPNLEKCIYLVEKE